MLGSTTEAPSFHPACYTCQIDFQFIVGISFSPLGLRQTESDLQNLKQNYPFRVPGFNTSWHCILDKLVEKVGGTASTRFRCFSS